MDKHNLSRETQPRRLNSLRHPDADYSAIGAYFITICTRHKDHLFGEIYNEHMHCNAFGMIVWDIWKSLPLSYSEISVDTAIVMPNHFHCIIVINNTVEAVHEPPRIGYSFICDEPPLRSHTQPRRVMTIPLVVGYFKMNAAKQINYLRETQGTHVWQRNYYDKIIESDDEYDAISEYILTNPSRWGLDKD
ncbi:MAG: transposase [Anaerolineaceae bacterium]